MKIGDRVKVNKKRKLIRKKAETIYYYGEVISMQRDFVVVKLDKGWNESFRYKDVEVYEEVEKIEDEGV